MARAQTIRPNPNLTSATVTATSALARSSQSSPLSFGYSISFGEFAAPDFSSRTYKTLPETYIFSDPVNKIYSQKILNALDVPGTVFRLNQGMLDWQRAISKNRLPLLDGDNPTSATGLPTTLVGLDEYLQFVEKVKGVPLIVLNLMGAYEQLPDGSFKVHEPVDVNDPNDPYWPGIVKREAALIEYLNAPAGADWVGDGVKRGGWRPANHPQPYNVWNFELDNETNIVGMVARYAPDANGVSAPILHSLRAEEFSQRAVAVVLAMRAVAHAGGNLEGKLRFIAQTVTPVANAMADSFDPNVLTDGPGGAVKEPLWLTQPTQSVFGYWNRALLGGTAGLSRDWSGVARIPSWVPTTEYDAATQQLNPGSTVNICGDTTPAHQAENTAWCATQYFNLVEKYGALGSPRSDGFYSPVNAQSSGLGAYLSGVGIHTYYDAPLWGYGEFNYWWSHELPMMGILPIDLTAKSIDAWYTNTQQTGGRPKVSITEYGRAGVINESGNPQHPQITGIYAAVGGADLALATAHRPFIDLMLHNGMAAPYDWWGQFAKIWLQPNCGYDTTSAFASNPPTLFCNGDGTYEFRPRAEARSINLVSRALYQADVLTTTVDSPSAMEDMARDLVPRPPTSFYGQYLDQSGASLGYDVRAVGLQYPGNGNKGVLAINRAELTYPLQINLPGFAAGDRKVVRLQSVGGSGLPNLTDTTQDPYTNPNYGNTWTRYAAVNFAGSPVLGQLNLPGHSVYSATVVGGNLLVNGDFESALSGSWTVGAGIGSSGTCTATSIGTSRAQGLNGVTAARLARGTATSCSLRQSSSSNSALSASGELGSNPFDTFVLRVNGRVSPGSDGVPVKTPLNALGLNVVINGSTAAMGSSATSDPALTAGYGWASAQIEFVPYMTLLGSSFSSAEIWATSTVNSLDIDGVTLMRRPNQAADPSFATLPNSSSKWQRSVPGSVFTNVASISLLSLSSPVRVQFRQAANASGVVTPMTLIQNAALQGTAASSLKIGGALDVGRNDIWRIKAMVGYSGLNGAGAVLKVKLFNQAGALISDAVQGAYQRKNGVPCSGTSPAPVLKGNSPGAYEVCLDFRPADIIGDSSYGGAEISVRYLDASLGGTLDVYYLTLERLAD